MRTCTYNLTHAPAEATHYYVTEGGSRMDLCFGCAGWFGYPEYLREYPREWAPQPGYLLNIQDGTGFGVPVVDTWTESEAEVNMWLSSLPAAEADWLLADAMYEPYASHFAEHGGETYELRRVTVLPMV
ncbi:hypothetical protein KGG77_gp03 [Streptomyces phage Omar]|uniref:Uncharacterized protein n=1 Tax=Streptomyces phage Omar TaxID=2059882 RepID=A0A2H5BLX6_9CAUD|nr:hypothetical protein KGG77_gp03 [Streptomyces phage Omar]AUG87265.1 hypothetical protein SEA_OMAR_81 [Streptomyces phage Omar]